MHLANNTVLVTGGASGIGFALAERFLAHGNTVIICGRRPEALAAAQRKHPSLHTRVCDLAVPAERAALVTWLKKEHPTLNVLVNNAGIQRRIDLTHPEPWPHTQQELASNLEAPIHLTQLLIPVLRTQKNPVIINVTSGLAFAPLASVPVYCATKAALHSFTLSLRHQLKQSGIAVIEIQPPAVDTDLGGPGLHTFGVNVNVFADAVFAQLESGEQEISYGFSKESSRASREQLDAIFARMNK
jgi:uncharacterized oxidoreductase